MTVAGKKFGFGDRGFVSIDVGNLYDFSSVNIPVEVIRGEKDGPVLFLSGAIHGDEINGVEIIRRVTDRITLKNLRGTVLAIPVVNIFGFNSRSRYLPDRRDLNRSFPGNARGSLAAQMAKKFMKEVVSKATHGIDFHTGAIHRYNIPQIRACVDEPKTRAMARAFNTKVIINSSLRDGSLREAARKKKIPMLLFEGGEALRFDESVIRAGVKGTLSVMQYLNMIPREGKQKVACESTFVKDSYWVRAPNGGSMRMSKKAGDEVDKGELLGVVSDLFGDERIEVRAREKGIIVGRTRLPLVNRGDALFHIATLKKLPSYEDVYEVL